MIRRLLITTSLLMLLLTYGCGNKGPLYLPQDGEPASTEQDNEPSE
ncbi:LPS translocon maturation chaperone LptM [Thiosocius teredinicola]